MSYDMYAWGRVRAYLEIQDIDGCEDDTTMSECCLLNVCIDGQMDAPNLPSSSPCQSRQSAVQQYVLGSACSGPSSHSSH